MCFVPLGTAYPVHTLHKRYRHGLSRTKSQTILLRLFLLFADRWQRGGQVATSVILSVPALRPVPPVALDPGLHQVITSRG